MAHVNLLPWREQQRQLQKKNYLGFLALVALTIGLIFWVAGQTIEQQTQHQNARNTFLTQEIAKLDAQISQIQKIKDKKSAIEQRMALIGQLLCPYPCQRLWPGRWSWPWSRPWP